MKAIPHGFQRDGEGRIGIQIGGVEWDGVGGGLQWRGFSGRVAIVAGRHLALDHRQIDRGAAFPQFLPAARGARGQAGRDEQLYGRIGEDDGADVATVQHRAACGSEIPLECEQGGADARDGGDRRGRGVGGGSSQIVPIQVPGPKLAGRTFRCRGIGGIATGIQDEAADRAIQQAGVEMGQAERVCQPTRQRALAGRRRTVDRNDRPGRHAAARSAPAWFIRATKPGKLVSMKAPSSTVTGWSVASPRTSAAIAIR